MKLIGNAIIKLLGILLIVAAALKFHQLYTTPVANDRIWTFRPFLIAQFTGELALGLWLLSGFFKKATWLMALMCFVFFCGVTVHKWVSGADSCGCFGNVHVTPWKTLFFVDVPAVILLAIFRPARDARWLRPVPAKLKLIVFIIASAIILTTTTTILALHEPPTEAETYVQLIPEEWIDGPLPITDRITISADITSGDWLLFFHRHECDNCQEAIPGYQDLAAEIYGNEDFLNIAFISLTPLEPDSIEPQETYHLGHLDPAKEWYVQTPVIAIVIDGIVRRVSEGVALDPQELLDDYLDNIME